VDSGEDKPLFYGGISFQHYGIKFTVSDFNAYSSCHLISSSLNVVADFPFVNAFIGEFSVLKQPKMTDN
jgi:hypothetical protein